MAVTIEIFSHIFNFGSQFLLADSSCIEMVKSQLNCSLVQPHPRMQTRKQRSARPRVGHHQNKNLLVPQLPIPYCSDFRNFHPQKLTSLIQVVQIPKTSEIEMSQEIAIK